MISPGMLKDGCGNPKREAGIPPPKLFRLSKPAAAPPSGVDVGVEVGLIKRKEKKEASSVN